MFHSLLFQLGEGEEKLKMLTRVDTQKPTDQFLNNGVVSDNLVIFKITLEEYVEVLFLPWSQHS